MSTSTILGLLWEFLNSPAGITTVGSIVLVALNKIYAAKPGWAKYEGAIISAIRHAEKAIPKDAPNKSLAKLDAALTFIVQAHEARTGAKLTGKALDAITEGIHIVHDKMAAQGSLNK